MDVLLHDLRNVTLPEPSLPCSMARTLCILDPSGATTLNGEHARRLQHPILGSMKELRIYKRMKLSERNGPMEYYHLLLPE